VDAASAAAQPSALTAKLAKPTSAYKRRAWLAVAALLGFVLLYFALASWFAFTAYKLTVGAGVSGKDPFWGWIIGLCAGFLSLFMWKAVFFVQRGSSGDGIEITAQEQGELFRFLHHLADKAGAPRPHRVFVSPRVNAAVFYDLSLLNLVFPSKKNLEIGLGLVNSLTLGELRAVLAHEFGHFAQRAMAVGRWVYMAQQIAAHLIARRDKLDDFLRALSHFDVRVAWVGWTLSLVVWAIRSLIDTAFQGVMLIQRALSREMEMNADLVAVSLTGSDALIHALHRLQAADDAWNRAHGFVIGGKARGRLTRDLFAIQSRVVEQMGQLFNDPDYGRVPAPPASDDAQAHRVFKAELAQPPQMWLTHPLNHEREANAKRHYVRAPIDERSAWVLFADATALRERVTAQLLGNVEGTPEPIADSLQVLNKQFEREFLDRRYRGVYFGRSVVRAAARVDELIEPCALQGAALSQALEALYPAPLTDEVERARSVEQELAQLRALHSGNLRPPGGSIAHRGRTITRAQLPQHIGQVERELEACHAHLREHDRRCRSLHRAAAAALGAGWNDHLEGLLQVMHYADHGEANLRDAQALLANTVAIVTATRRVNKAGVERTVRDAGALYMVLSTLYSQAASVELGPTLQERLGVAKWPDALGELGLNAASNDNIQAWLNAVDGWVNHTASALSALHDHALEQLLRVEADMARHLRDGTQPEAAAPVAPRVAPGYAVLLPGQRRKRQTRLDWWARFQTADGALPTAARLLVAGAIVAVVLGVGGTVGSAKLVVHNGLARDVSVKVGDKRSLTLAPHANATIDIDAEAGMPIETHTREGQLIERFDADAGTRYGQYVYNVAGAALLVEWMALYGGGTPPPQQLLGGPRWTSTNADHLFTEPPKSLRSKGPTSRRVLESPRDATPGDILGALPNDDERLRVATAHARWDRLDARQTMYWLYAAQAAPQFKSLLAQRLAESPDNVLLLRLAQDSVGADERAAVCRAHEAQAAAAPANANLQYMRVRCIADGAAKNQAFDDGQRQHPDHAWFAYAAGYTAAEKGQWTQALTLFERARRKDASMAEWVGVDIARLRRVLGQDAVAVAQPAAAPSSDALRRLLQLESGEELAPDSPARAYAELAQGRLERALQLAGKDKDTRARVLRLAAASDGADAALVTQALALPADMGLDDGTVWSSMALTARAGHDVVALPAAARRVPPAQSAQLLAFIAALRSGARAEQAEALLDGLGPEMRGHGYSIGSTLLGNKAPAAWRDKAKRLLFAAERPYFH
jgi:Zn-dependent protease with chaperone function